MMRLLTRFQTRRRTSSITFWRRIPSRGWVRLNVSCIPGSRNLGSSLWSPSRNQNLRSSSWGGDGARPSMASLHFEEWELLSHNSSWNHFVDWYNHPITLFMTESGDGSSLFLSQSRILHQVTRHATRVYASAFSSFVFRFRIDPSLWKWSPSHNPETSEYLMFIQFPTDSHDFEWEENIAFVELTEINSGLSNIAIIHELLSRSSSALITDSKACLGILNLFKSWIIFVS